MQGQSDNSTFSNPESQKLCCVVYWIHVTNLGFCGALFWGWWCSGWLMFRVPWQRQHRVGICWHNKTMHKLTILKQSTPSNLVNFFQPSILNTRQQSSNISSSFVNPPLTPGLRFTNAMVWVESFARMLLSAYTTDHSEFFDCGTYIIPCHKPRSIFDNRATQRPTAPNSDVPKMHIHVHQMMIIHCQPPAYMHCMCMKKTAFDFVWWR